MKIERFFNTAGPVRPLKNYCIDPLSRFDLDEIQTLIRQEKYFILHAPRQTGKTSFLLALIDFLNKQGKYKALYTNLESAQAARENVKEGMRAILNALSEDALDLLNDSFLEEKWQEILEQRGEFSAFKHLLSLWCRQSEKPVVLFIDEVDSLVGDTLISLLRQLRRGYPNRPALFPQSIILCGIRDVKDYRMHSDIEKAIITGGSAFNIKAKSLKLGNFSLEEIKMLYGQHTTETGQHFSNDIFPLVWDLTEGQPWLVNAVAYEACFEMKEGQDRGKAITVDMIQQAKENLILRRETHLDQLTDKLKEERVKGVLMPLLVGSGDIEEIPEDDIDYAVDLGLIKRKPQLAIANRIYQEIIPRQLTNSAQATMVQEASWYMTADGRLDMDQLLTAFQDFFRKHFESWVDGFDYAEAGAQLLLQAFLQRIVNGGGRVEREYGLGRMRTDLLVIWPLNIDKNLPGDHYSRFYKAQQAVVELKLLHGSLQATIKQGLEQTYTYMDKCGAKEGYLLIFNPSTKKPWREKLFKKTGTFKDVKINIYGM
ncbi:MAG: AAA-like domain-containing protein [Candidatus Aminicenantes bacterium]|nr:AAA-like domain-containing protein [Candidatus Aminicenantes bacterium]